VLLVLPGPQVPLFSHASQAVKRPAVGFRDQHSPATACALSICATARKADSSAPCVQVWVMRARGFAPTGHNEADALTLPFMGQ
jgi:hypothetical protein